MKRLKAVAVTAVVLLLTAGPVLAGQYELARGKGVKVCEAYRKNLNSFQPSYPMRCNRPVNPEFKDFQKPKWEQIDGIKDFDLIVKVDKLLRPSYYAHIKPEVMSSSLRANIESGNYKFSLTTVDIDNDGRVEPVLRYLDSCWPGNRGPWGTPLVVLKQDKRDVDVSKTAHGRCGSKTRTAATKSSSTAATSFRNSFSFRS